MSDERVIESGNYLRTAKDLRVYQAAFDLSVEIHRITLGFPKIEQYALADQMRRASKSICSNLSEGFAKQKFSPAEFNRFLAIASGSAAEMGTWIDYALIFEYIDETQAANWQEKYDHIMRMLYRLRATS